MEKRRGVCALGSPLLSSCPRENTIPVITTRQAKKVCPQTRKSQVSQGNGKSLSDVATDFLLIPHGGGVFVQKPQVLKVAGVKNGFHVGKKSKGYWEQG